MGYATVIVSFIVCLSFNVFLNSFDVYSDILLSFNALTFDLGDSILLSGCRVCHGKDDNDIFRYKNKSCQQCLVRSAIMSDKVVFHVDDCGLSYEILNKIHVLEKKDTCENEPLSLSFHFFL